LKQLILIVTCIVFLMSSIACEMPTTTPAPVPTPTPEPTTTPVPTQQVPAETSPSPTQVPPASGDGQPSLELAGTSYEQFLTYEKFRQFEKMWPMLHPDSQDIFDDADDYVSGKDNPYSLKEWAIGLPQLVAQWTCESTETLIGTDATYSNVAEVPVTWVYSTALGDMERSQMVHAVAVNGAWKYFEGKNKPIPEVTPAPPPVPTTPSPTTTAVEIGNSRSNPVPVGHSLVTEGAEVRVLQYISGDQAWDIAYRANSYNDPPANGMQYIIITVNVKNISSIEEPQWYSDIHFELVGSSNKLFQSFDKSLVLPDEGSLSGLNAKLFHGGEIIGSIHFYVPADETDLVLISNFGYSFSDSNKRYFGVQ
jgi:hypothetical protein